LIDLTDKTVLLTGASNGIGFEAARALGLANANVIAHWRSDRNGVERATQTIPSNRKLLLRADFAEEGSAIRLWRDAVSWNGRIDVLINNAGILPEAAVDDSDEQWDAAWKAALTVNVLEPAALMREAIGHFRHNQGGIVITVSSWVVHQGSGNPKLVAYAASKAALAAATKTIARAYASDGVLAYCVAPGAVRTDMTIQSARNQGGESAVTSALVMGEMVPPAEVANLMVFLATGSCKHLSGATLDINGASYIR
jgi:NAD(P)-dependent dehydrogenase (short-subunit alcohol dehydrogenase family)